MNMRKRRGVSPVVASVLLIAMVVVIGLIVFLWMRSLVGEGITKNDKNVELVCEEVEYDASYTAGELAIVNTGDVPIYSFKIKISDEAGHTTEDINDLADSWPDSGLNAGGAFSGDIGSHGTIVLIPVLMGSTSEETKTYVCDERQHGFEIEES